jgi:hypothetical protein
MLLGLLILSFKLDPAIAAANLDPLIFILVTTFSGPAGLNGYIVIWFCRQFWEISKLIERAG